MATVDAGTGAVVVVAGIVVVVGVTRLLVDATRNVVVVVGWVVVVVEGAAVVGTAVASVVDVVVVAGTVAGVATGTKSKVAGVDSDRSHAARSMVAATTEKIATRALNARLGAMDRHPIEWGTLLIRTTHLPGLT
ncbi:MAG: hypothetical protein ACFCVC_12360 [Acidimicrobiia bacterium]